MSRVVVVASGFLKLPLAAIVLVFVFGGGGALDLLHCCLGAGCLPLLIFLGVTHASYLCLHRCFVFASVFMLLPHRRMVCHVDFAVPADGKPSAGVSGR